MKRLLMATVAIVVAVAWAGAATAGAQTQEDTDFGGGTHAGTSAIDDLTLSPDFDVAVDFSGTTLPAGWEMSVWNPGGSATVGGGTLTVDGARANTTARYDAGRSLDFAATFTADRFQHVGFGEDFNDAPWAMFSTGGGALPVGFYARTLAPGGAPENTPITGADPLVEHEYSIEWTPTEVRYYVDGALVATHAIAITAQMRPIASDFDTGGGSVQVDYLNLYSYPNTGTFTSRVFDAGDHRATWRALNAVFDTPAGTGVTFEVHTGSTPTPDASWTAWQPVGPGGEVPGPFGRRYLQYRATLTTTDTSVTPVVRSVTVGYDLDTSAPATAIGGVAVSGTTARVTFSSEAGARFECSLDSGPFHACTSPRDYTGLAAGSHTVRVRAIDQVGNVGVAVEGRFVINSTDTTAPKVRPKPRTVYVSDNGRLKVSLRCPNHEVRCRIGIRIRYRGKTIASKAVTVWGGTSKTVTLKLKPSARTALNLNSRLSVTAITRARDAAGNSATTTTRLKLRA